MTQRTRTAASAKQDGGSHEAYVGFARSVRVWFIAYGIGAPVLFLTNKEASGTSGQVTACGVAVEPRGYVRVCQIVGSRRA